MSKLSLEISEKLFGMETSLVKVFILPIVMIVLFLVSLSMVILPKVDDINRMRSEKASLEKKIKTLTEKRDYFLNLDEEGLKEQDDFVVNALMKDKNAYVLVGLFKKITEEYGFRIESFSVSPGKAVQSSGGDKDKDVWVKVNTSLSLVGPKDKYLDLVNRLEDCLPILSIDGFKTQTTLNAIEIELVVSAYYVQDKTAVNVSNLGLNELVLSKAETDLITKLREFRLEYTSETVKSVEGEYLKYQREDPFNL